MLIFCILFFLNHLPSSFSLSNTISLTSRRAMELKPIHYAVVQETSQTPAADALAQTNVFSPRNGFPPASGKMHMDIRL